MKSSLKKLLLLSMFCMTISAQEAVMSWTTGLTVNTNFGGWTGDYFTSYYVSPGDGWANSIEFNVSDLPDVVGGSLSVAIYSANYPWDEINEAEIADNAPECWLGYYENNDTLQVTGDSWVFGGINDLEGANPDNPYDPLGEKRWPESGFMEISLTPNESDVDTIILDLASSEFGPFYFAHNDPFMVVVKLVGFDVSLDQAEYRTGFWAAQSSQLALTPCLKFYNLVSSPNGRTGANDWGWHIRSYVWDWSVVVDIIGPPYFVIQVEELSTTLSTNERTVSFTIQDYNPEANLDWVESAAFVYVVNDADTVITGLSLGEGNEFIGIIPGQRPGTKVNYWVEVTPEGYPTRFSQHYWYEIFEPTNPMLFVYDADDLGVGTAEYFYNTTLADTFKNNFDTWEARFGPITTELINYYEIVYHVMGGGPYNDASSYSSTYSQWLASGSVDAPTRLFITGHDYGVISGYADTTFPADAFENHFLGIETLGPQDVAGWSPWSSLSEPYAVDAVANDPLTGHLEAFESDSLQLFYWPSDMIGVENWIDNLTPSTGTVCFTDPNNNDAAVAVYNEGIGWKTAFWALDPISLEYYSPIDTTNYYHWALMVGDGPLAPTFDWFEPPHFWRGMPADAIADPVAAKLYSNYPNPFNPVTNITYELSESADINITVYNMLGQEVITIVDGHQIAGSYSVQWVGNDQAGHSVPSGVYFYTMRTEGFIATQKMILLK